MLVLAIETTGKYGSAALYDDEGVVVSATSKEEMNHLKEVINLCQKCLDEKGAKTSDITHVAASVGPGSFTGIRIGVTSVRTLAQMLSVSCVSVSSLEGMAHNATDGAKAKGASYICPIINARRHQTYAGIWKLEGDSIVEAYEQKQYMIEEVMEIASGLDGMIYFTGDGIDAYADIIEEALACDKYAFIEEEKRYPDAKMIAKIATSKIEEGETCSYNELLPNYMRLSEAEMRLKEGTLSRKIRR